MISLTFYRTSEWRQTNVKWVNQELSPGTKSNNTSGLGLSNSGVPYSDIGIGK